MSYAGFVPVIGTINRFIFTNKYTALNGTYIVTGVTTFEAALLQGVDFVKNFYTPAGLSDQDYTDDYTSLLKSTILEVKAPQDTATTVYYFPLPFLATSPDPTVKQYQYIYLNLPIGYFKDNSEFSWIKSQLEDTVASITGQATSGIWQANPGANTYMTDAEYQAVDATRKAQIKTIQPLTTQIEAQKEFIAKLQNLISIYEQALITTSSSS